MSCSTKRNNFNLYGGSVEKIEVILFHANWCGACIRFIKSGDWDEIKKQVEDLKLGIHFEQYEEHDEIKNSNHKEAQKLISGWPTLVIIKNGIPQKYTGFREVNVFVNYLTNLRKGKPISGGLPSKYSQIPSQCGGGKKNFKNDEYYKLKYLKYKAKYMLEKSKN